MERFGSSFNQIVITEGTRHTLNSPVGDLNHIAIKTLWKSQFLQLWLVDKQLSCPKAFPILVGHFRWDLILYLNKQWNLKSYEHGHELKEKERRSPQEWLNKSPNRRLRGMSREVEGHQISVTWFIGQGIHLLIYVFEVFH